MTAPREPDEDSVPAGAGARLILTLTPFLAVAVVWLVLRWITP